MPSVLVKGYDMEPESQGYVNQDGPEVDPKNRIADTDADPPVEPPKPDVISEALEKWEKECEVHREVMNSARPFLRVAEEAVAKFGGSFRLCSWTGRAIFIWTVKVNEFADVAPYVTWLEDECKMPCTKTIDHATKYDSDRTYWFGDFFHLRAELINENVCKKVLVGYQEVQPQPIYKFECPGEPFNAE